MNARPSPHWFAKYFKGRLRWFLIGWMFVVSAVAYLDRVNISIAGQAIQKDYGLTDVQLGWVFSAFLIGYAVFQVPGGWLADRYGPQLVISVGVVWWGVVHHAHGIGVFRNGRIGGAAGRRTLRARTR